MGRSGREGNDDEEDDYEISNLSAAKHADMTVPPRPVFETPAGRSSARASSALQAARPQSTIQSKFEEERRSANAWFQRQVDKCNNSEQFKGIMQEWNTFMNQMEESHRNARSGS